MASIARWFARLGEATCVGCGVEKRAADRAIAGPSVLICDRCVRRAAGLLDGWRPGEVRTAAPGAAARRCSFCGKGREECFGLLAFTRGAICGECVVLCEGILQEPGAPPE